MLILHMYQRSIFTRTNISKYFSNPCKKNDIYLAATLGLNVDRAKRGLVISITQIALHQNSTTNCKLNNSKS